MQWVSTQGNGSPEIASFDNGKDGRKARLQIKVENRFSLQLQFQLVVKRRELTICSLYLLLRRNLLCSVGQRLQQRIPPILIELDVQLGRHLVREVEQLPTA